MARSSVKHNARAIAPVSLSMVLSLVAYRWSLLSASVSFTCIIKTLAPVFTMIFSYIIVNEPTTWTRCASVIPVVVGVALTSATEVEFSLPGTMAALIATASQALQMVLAKRLLSAGGWTKAELFYAVAVSGFATLLLMVILFESRDLYVCYASPATPESGSRSAAVGWTLVNGLCSFCNQYAGLSVLDRFSTPLSHALANVLKRAVVVMLAMAHAQMPVTPLHMCGAVLSIFGALAYQQAIKWGSRIDGGDYAPVPLTDVDSCIDSFKRVSGISPAKPLSAAGTVPGGRKVTTVVEMTAQLAPPSAAHEA
jgi:drug/metabolite transporter (DMT)-like permease